MSKALLAIDPGLSGGIAWRLPNYIIGRGCLATNMPDTEGDILQTLSEYKRTCDIEKWELVAYVEAVPIGMPGKGAAMAKLNSNAAFIRGCLMALGVRIIMVRPTEWQSFYNLGKRSGCKSDSEWKGKLKGEAQRRFPNLKVTLKTADALLLLEYAKANNL